MNRWSIAFCLSVSFVAVGLAGFALLESRSGGPESRGTDVQDLHELRTLLKSLQEKVSEHEARLDALKLRAPKKRALEPGVSSTETREQDAEAPAPGQTGGLREQVAALTQRLAILENEETIAQLAKSGRVQVAEKELTGALDQVGDPDVFPQTRLEALKSLRRLWKTDRSLVAEAMEERGLKERDVVLPMLEIAQDTTLDPDFRADVVRNFYGSRVEELRQPMLDLLAFDEAPGVREEALTALLWHLDDSTVREAITQVSQEDRHEDVRARAEEFMPKVEYVAREEAKSAGTAGAGQEK